MLYAFLGYWLEGIIFAIPSLFECFFFNYPYILGARPELYVYHSRDYHGRIFKDIFLLESDFKKKNECKIKILNDLF